MIARRHLVTITRSIQGGRYGWLVRWLVPYARCIEGHRRHSQWCAVHAEAVRLRAFLEHSLKTPAPAPEKAGI